MALRLLNSRNQLQIGSKRDKCSCCVCSALMSHLCSVQRLIVQFIQESMVLLCVGMWHRSTGEMALQNQERIIYCFNFISTTLIVPG